MATKPPRRFEVVSYRNTAGKSMDVVVDNIQESAPLAADITIATNTTGGTLAAATYSYRVSAVVAGIETTASTAKTQATTGATSTVTLDWTAAAAKPQFVNASAFKVYGRTGGSELLMATVNMPTKTFTDDASVTPSGALPAVSTAVSFRNRGTKATQQNVAAATAMKQTNVYYNF